MDEETTVLGPDDLAIVEPGRSTEPRFHQVFGRSCQGNGGWIGRLATVVSVKQGGISFVRPRVTRVVHRVGACPTGRERVGRERRIAEVESTNFRWSIATTSGALALTGILKCREREHGDHAFVGALVTRAIRCLSPGRVPRSQTSDGTVHMWRLPVTPSVTAGRPGPRGSEIA